MRERSSVSLILPAYNEVRRIAEVVREAAAYFERRAQPYEVIVSADGTDGTREAAQEIAAANPRVRVIGNARRRGKGRGIREGVALAHGDIIGFADADNKTPIENYDRFEPYLRDGYDIVVGSRAVAGAQIERVQPPWRRFGSRAFFGLIQAIVGLPGIVDSQCGFKFFQRRAAFDLFGRQRINGGMFDVEVLRMARRTGYRIAQVPVRWRYDGDSHLTAVQVAGDIIDLVRIRVGP